MSKLEKTLSEPSLRGGGCGWWVVATLQVWTLLPARGSAPSVARLGAQPRPEVDSILLHNLGPVTASTPSSQPQHTPVSTLSSQLASLSLQGAVQCNAAPLTPSHTQGRDEGGQ